MRDECASNEKLALGVITQPDLSGWRRSSLDKVESRVESLMPDLRRAASNSAAEYARVNEEFFGLKQQACCQVHELLVTNGIDVSVKRVESAVNSYRVGR